MLRNGDGVRASMRSVGSEHISRGPQVELRHAFIVVEAGDPAAAKSKVPGDAECLRRGFGERQIGGARRGYLCISLARNERNIRPWRDVPMQPGETCLC